MGSATTRLVLAAALLAVAVAPSHADDVRERIAEGIRLHDAGDFDGAIDVYRSVLKDHPHDRTAVYELAFSWASKGAGTEELARFIEEELASGFEQSPALPMILGWAYDDLRRYDKAEQAFRRALASIPDDATANYNLGVNLALQSRFAESAEAYLKALRANPDYVSAWNGLAAVLEAQGRKARAFAAYARVAAAEPDTKRGRAAAERLWPLLFAGVERKDAGDGSDGKQNVTITVPRAPEGGSDADAHAGAEFLAVSVVAASRFTEPKKAMSDAAFFADAFDTVTKIVSELSSDGKDPFWSLALPFFDEARKKGHMEALAYDVRRTAGDAEAAAWIAKSPEKMKAYAAWMGR